MIRVEDFVPYIAAEVPECPPFIVQRAVMDAVTEFCKTTWALNYETDPEDIEAGEINYEFSAPSQTYPIGIIEVRYDGEPLDKYTEMEMDRRWSGWKSHKGEPRVFIPGTRHNDIRIYPIPDKDYPEMLTARVAYCPVRTSERLDDMFQNFHFSTVVDGATAVLLFQQQKSWFNPQVAPLFRKKFEDALFSARNLVMRNIYQRRPPVPQL